jgi:hypothetical protein
MPIYHSSSELLDSIKISSWAVPPIGNYTLPRRFVFGYGDYIAITL